MIADNFYHIYNRGNNREPIFFSKENYWYFLRKIRHHFLKHVDILAYCLMPNHFHFLVYAKETINAKAFGNDLRVMLRSYTRAINNQEDRTGSLFQQHTKVKPLENDASHTMTQSHSMTSTGASLDYPLTCFHYIHQNPMKAGLVKRMEDYEMSSFRDYAGLGGGSLCNIELAKQLLDLPVSVRDFVKESYKVQIISEQMEL